MSKPPNPLSSDQLLGLDVGKSRIGVARASVVARLAEPLELIEVNGTELQQISELCRREHANKLVVGLPRGLDGQETDQTAYTRAFIEKLRQAGLEVVTIDEAGTSVAAKELLKERYRPHWRHESIDAVAAMILLNDYLETI